MKPAVDLTTPSCYQLRFPSRGVSMRNRERVLLLFILAAFWSAMTAGLHAQVTTATLLGAVRDTSGAVIPGATVIAAHQGTGVTREAVTDERGEFVLTALATGPYAVRIALPG